MASYPKWLYHPTAEARIVRDEAEHKSLPPGWAESPADAAKPSAPEATPTPEPKEEKSPRKVK